jgi:SAM-dependent methyltransferase
MTAVQGSVASAEDRYGPVLASHRLGGTLEGIWQRVYGDDYPASAEPFGFVTMTDLRSISYQLAAAGVSRLIDIGCGSGGPGLWVAEDLGASLVGIDIIPEAIETAVSRAADSHPSVDAAFSVASATNTDRPTASFDGAMSVDALWMVHDKTAAFTELARLLRPGSPLVFSTWEPSHLDYAWFLEPAGFTDITKTEVAGSLKRQLAVYRQILSHRSVLTDELGADATAVLVAEAEEAPEMLPFSPRLMIKAFAASENDVEIDGDLNLTTGTEGRQP